MAQMQAGRGQSRVQGPRDVQAQLVNARQPLHLISSCCLVVN